MPYKFESQKKKIRPEDKRNIKLTKADKEKIIEEYKTGLFSQRKLAQIWKVDKSTIRYIVNPEVYEKLLERTRIANKEKTYYSKEKHKEYMRNLRKHKKELQLKDKLI